MDSTLKTYWEVFMEYRSDLYDGVDTMVAGERHVQQLEAQGFILPRGIQGPTRQ